MKWLLFLVAICVGGDAFTQQPTIKTYSAQDGLVGNYIRKIYQDSKGFLWFATWEGLSKYDGHKFTNFTMANGLSWNLVNDIYESNDGKLFVALNNGAVDVVEHDEVIRNAVFSEPVVNRFYRLSNNRIVVGSDFSGLMEFDGHRLKPLQRLKDSRSYSHLSEWQDSLFLGAFDYAVSVMNDNYEVIDEIKQHDGSLKCMYVDSKGRGWVGVSSGLKLLSGRRENSRLKFELLSCPFSIPVVSKNPVSSIYEDSKGHLWVGTSDHGFVRIDADGRWTHYSEKDGLPSNEISGFLEDTEGNIWIGTSLGIAKLVTKNNIQIFSTPRGQLTGFVFGIVPLDNNNLLIANTGGTQKFNKLTHEFTMESQPNASFSYSNGNYLLLSTRYGNKCVVSDSKKTMWVNSSIFPCYAMVFHNQNLIVATEHGVRVITPDNVTYDVLRSQRVNNLLVDKKGRLWVGTWSNGLHQITYSIEKGNIKQSIRSFANLLPGVNVRSLFEDRQGNIWIGMRYNGIACLRESRNGEYSIQNWDYQHGLMTSWIQAINEDHRGNIWLGTYLGVDKLVKLDTGFRVFNFSRINNLYGNTSSIFIYDSHIFFVMRLGFVMISDDEMEKSPALPAFITHASLGNSAKTSVTRSNPKKKLLLKHDQNHAYFEFTAPGYINEKQILYSYRLKGVDDTTWSTPSNTHHISYASLRPGNYRFEVRTLGWEGKYGATDYFEFEIRPPYWQTWWFRSMAVLLIAFVVAILVRKRIKSIRHEAEMKQRIAETETMALRAQMNPHFIFNCINSIDSLIQNNDKYNATVYLNKFAKLIRGILDSSRQSTVSLSRDLEILKLYIELEQFRNENKFSASIQVDDSVLQDDYKVPPLIIQPYVENAILHGLRNRRDSNGKLTVSVCRRNNHIEYIIQDNGVGRDAKVHSNQETKSYGMQISSDRVKHFNKEEHASVSVSDLFDNGKPAGTKVTVRLHVQ